MAKKSTFSLIELIKPKTLYRINSNVGMRKHAVLVQPG